MERKTKILLVDDHPLVRKGFISLITESENSQYEVDEAEDGLMAVKMATNFDYDLILMDITMPGRNGIDCTREIVERKPDTNIIALSMHDEISYVNDMIESGAKGYILKNASAEELFLSIETVKTGKRYFSTEISERLYEKSRGPAARFALTRREEEILQLIIKGKTSLEISKELFISKRTVDNHRNNILNKLMVKNTAELINFAYNNGLVTPFSGSTVD